MERKRSRTLGKAITLPEPDFLPKKIKGNELPRIQNKYFNHYPRQAYFLTLMGFTLTQVAQVFEVQFNTIQRWMEKYDEFREAIRKGGEIADGKVAHALYKRALGYSHPGEVILSNRIREYDDKGKIVKEYTEPLRVPVTKQYPPDTTAAFKWLRARQPGVWANRVEVKTKITMHHEVDLTKFSNEELELLSKLSNDKNRAEDTPYEEV